jgi:hypothetical protein
MRTNKLLYDEYTRIYNGPANQVTPACNPCFEIKIIGSTFSNFGQMKVKLTNPVAVNPVQKMQYTGQVLDLDGFGGTVLLQSNIFKYIGLQYPSCGIAKTM